MEYKAMVRRLLRDLTGEELRMVAAFIRGMIAGRLRE